MQLQHSPLRKYRVRNALVSTMLPGGKANQTNDQGQVHSHCTGNKKNLKS